MTETYTIVLRSESLTGNTQYTTGTISSIFYKVDWITVLPKKYRKFKVSSYFRTGYQAGAWATPETICIHCPSITNSTTFDSANSSRSSLLAIAERCVDYNVTSATSNTYFISRASDIPFITINYPNEEFINIQLRDTTSALIADANLLQEYILILNFEGIE